MENWGSRFEDLGALLAGGQMAYDLRGVGLRPVGGENLSEHRTIARLEREGHAVVRRAG